MAAFRVLPAVLLCGCAALGPRHGLVDLSRAAPSIRTDLRYATPQNFVGRPLYSRAACFLEKGVAERLRAVQSDLEARGLGLKVYDCYRPLSVQKKLWAIVPDERYVANPSKGSRHNRGYAVDLTLVDLEGSELEMPTAYDDFTEKARRDAPASPEATKNRGLLEEAMARQGFAGLSTEWWHFDLPGWEKAPLLDVSLEELP